MKPVSVKDRQDIAFSISGEDRKFLVRRSGEETIERGRPVSLSEVVREIIAAAREKIEAEKAEAVVHKKRKAKNS